MTHAWWPTSAGMLIAEGPTVGASGAVVAWTGAARPRMAAMNPLATTAANPNLCIVIAPHTQLVDGKGLAGGLSERHIPKAVGSVGLIVVVHVVTGHVGARGIGAIRHQRVGIG